MLNPYEPPKSPPEKHISISDRAIAAGLSAVDIVSAAIIQHASDMIGPLHPLVATGIVIALLSQSFVFALQAIGVLGVNMPESHEDIVCPYCEYENKLHGYWQSGGFTCRRCDREFYVEVKLILTYITSKPE